MAPPAALPELMPLLPVRERVLLPSSILRVVVASPKSLALVDALLTSKEPLDGVWLGVVPLLPAGSAPREALEAEDGDRLHSVGCAARVLQISRFPASRRCGPPRHTHAASC
jgi:ATP-dependent Lon protease